MRAPFLIAIVLALCASCSDDEPRMGRGGGVLLIAIESLRADHLSCYGYDRATTPALDALARDGVRFDNAFSSAPWILPASMSLLSGCDPNVSRRFLPPDVPAALATTWHLAKDAPHVAHEFLRRGYATAAFVDHPLLGRAYGCARGFRDFSEPAGDEAAPEELGTTAVLSRLRRWLDERDADTPWFAFVQLDDLDRTWWQVDAANDTYFAPREGLDLVPPTADADHAFHAIPRPRWSGGLRTLGEYEAEYDGALRKLDAALGRLFDELRKSGRLERTSVCVVSTHGLGFGEAGLYLDSGTLTDVDLRVPLILRPASSIDCRRGALARSLASLVDVGPTLLALEGLPAPSEMQGVSLTPALTDPTTNLRPFAFASCGYQEGWCVFGPRYCYERTEPWKSMDSVLVSTWYGGSATAEHVPREVLHDRAERANIGHATSLALDPAVVDPMRAALERWKSEVDTLRGHYNPSEWLQVELAPAAKRDP